MSNLTCHSQATTVEEGSDDDDDDHIECMVYTTNNEIIKQGLLLVNYTHRQIKRANMKCNIKRFKGHSLWIQALCDCTDMALGGSTNYTTGG
jgi:hypothetical protein